MNSPARERLANREIALLLHILDRAGLSGRVTLPPMRRNGLVVLWRRHLVEIWYRCAPDEGCAHGPYFNLTVDGHQLAVSIRAAREARRGPRLRAAQPHRGDVTMRDYDPGLGQAFQGDVSIIPIPDGISISALDEISPRDGRLILQEGEVSGHHHAIDLRGKNFQAQPRETGDPLLATRDPKLKRALGGAAKAASVRMYRDAAVPNEMVRRGILTRADLAIACLVVEGAAVVVTHEEHDGIRLPVGRYLIGRQVESAGAEERIIAD
ncbi:hypothetical protein JQ594_15365 [Bradyrhizobium manausense]|uniref:hypothetical protein n=1 Tax=Bradyrhizobium manausense TaxID=989370 RepID=UPI001BA74278|nr:hypothetical protein [Bradyrhizobium manausense]MBR0687309.1 hypothetical protein [Bradyrhizobium manausense]